MHRTGRLLALCCTGVLVAALSACSGAKDDKSAAPVGPTATTSVAPDGAAERAARYRDSGGDRDVRGIEQSEGKGRVPRLTVWTQNPDTDDKPFQRLKQSVVDFLATQEGVAFDRGYLMDVFGPDGELLHRLDTRA